MFNIGITDGKYHFVCRELSYYCQYNVTYLSLRFAFPAACRTLECEDESDGFSK